MTLQIHCNTTNRNRCYWPKPALLDLNVIDECAYIQSISKWLIHNRKYAKTIVGVWYLLQPHPVLHPQTNPLKTENHPKYYNVHYITY